MPIMAFRTDDHPEHGTATTVDHQWQIAAGYRNEADGKVLMPDETACSLDGKALGERSS
jgi:hypothetical protein